ncbi:response regulator [Trinickia soli]|uniref:DNA-binding response regulator n=1 Tax=Trinickia soli TaxID=380675 RepID=A0A2N7VNH4_9BURK|nr:response regulator [Trinickia soli]PMS18690.1 DNA-binding response regulator [Trinickia soli]CAB3714907.1 KDP operon transcriptional regulatory protein KdpE [Trinickia soli]
MTESAITVLLIEDDKPIRRLVQVSLEAESIRFLESDTGRKGLSLAASARPDLIIIDLGLPDMDGADVIRQLRDWSSVPVIVLSARTREEEKVAALDAGADDYLTKPFGVPELLARIRAQLRRRNRSASDPSSKLQFGAIEIDFEMRTVRREGQPVHLTPIEYRLLTSLARHAGRVLTHRQLLHEVWGPSRVESPHYLRIYMGHLRQKLERDPAQPEHIMTETGVGYRLVGVL